MNIKFYLRYVTSFGEELTLNVITSQHPLQVKKHRMTTHNGSEWTGELHVTSGKPVTVDYYYSVEKNGNEQRCEWLIMPHRLSLSNVSTALCHCYDRWIDIPEDAPLYSAAFPTPDLQQIPATCHKRAITLKVRAPQLRPNERLAVVGNEGCMGEWDANRALEMQQVQPHEWGITMDEDMFCRPLIEYKYVIIDKNGEMAPLWETCANRSIATDTGKEGECMVYEMDDAHFPIGQWRAAGVVIPVFSLRSEGSFGVGDFGDLKKMVDWAEATRMRVIQVLPINDTVITHTWQDSYPYNSISIYALHPQYIDLRQLPALKDAKKRNKYKQLQEELNKLPQIDYEQVSKHKMAYLRDLYKQLLGEEKKNMLQSEEYHDFETHNSEWLLPYAVFCHYREKYGTACFDQWKEKVTIDTAKHTVCSVPRQGGKSKTINIHEGAMGKDIAFWTFVQFCLDKQMKEAHDYARAHRVILKGDIPIGISRYGVEAWMEPKYFNLNGQAGAPPDDFSAYGQNWGFPTYNWRVMKEDNYEWWKKRFRKMAEYFDAYRIDHVLGFFRIWEIPSHAVNGLLGHFSPALAMTKQEIEAYGLAFHEKQFTQPYIRNWIIDKLFGEQSEYVKTTFLTHQTDDCWNLKDEFSTERKIEAYFNTLEATAENEALRDGLYHLVNNVLFVIDTEHPHKFHPRISVQNDTVYEALNDSDKFVFNRLYNDYFYRRNNHFWYGEAQKKLPQLTQCTNMLVCAEDLGMVPDCVPWLMKELRILTLEIQSMPKEMGIRFGHLSRNPYRSVCTISTHDMPPLRQWWDEDHDRAQAYYNERLHHEGTAPHPMPSWLAQEVVQRHLACPSMLCLLSFQDWLAISDTLRLPDASAERINIPAHPRHYWRYRMHLSIEQLLAATDLNNTIRGMISQSGRK